MKYWHMILIMLLTFIAMALTSKTIAGIYIVLAAFSGLFWKLRFNSASRMHSKHDMSVKTKN